MRLDMNHGTLAGRVFKAKAIAQDELAQLHYIEAQRWVDDHFIKAAVAPHMTTNAYELVSRVGRDFVNMIRPATLLGRMSGLRRVPFTTRTTTQTGGVNAQWIGEFGPKPVQPMAFEEQDSLMPRKVAAISVITQELARAAQGAENELLRDLGDAAVQAVDLAFIDPDNAGEAGERPASITNGQPTFTSSGSDAAAAREDFRVLARNYRGNWRSAVVVMDSVTAVALAQMPSALGGGSIDIANGTGVVFGVPLLITDARPQDSSGGYLSLIDASGVQLAGLVDAELKATREALIQMSNTPTDGAAQMVSMWQCNSIAMLGEVLVNWQAVRSEVAVSIIDVSYEI